MRLIALVLLGLASPAVAETPQPTWTLKYSNFVSHYRSNPEHNNNPGLVGIELRRDQWLAGGATFRNSFSQRSHYAYIGRRFDAPSAPVFLKLTGGVLHGYRGEHKRKIPLNDLGVAPAIIPSVGVQKGRFSGELVVLGESALMLTLGHAF